MEDAASLQTASGDVVVVAGLLSGSGDAAQLIAELRLTPDTEPESLLIRKFNREGKTVVLVAGADARGLMYALLDVADRVGWAKSPEQPFSEVRDTQEKPFAPERALSIYTMNRAYWESRFYDEAYWARYLDLLAQNRFNSLVVIFGYENGGFLAPCYPYFFDVEEFPDVRMVGITPRAAAAQPRRAQPADPDGARPRAEVHGRASGTTSIAAACRAAAFPEPTKPRTKPVARPGLGRDRRRTSSPTPRRRWPSSCSWCPTLDAIQFRMHDESGLKNSEQEAFWRDVFQMMKEHGAEPALRCCGPRGCPIR